MLWNRKNRVGLSAAHQRFMQNGVYGLAQVKLADLVSGKLRVIWQFTGYGLNVGDGCRCRSGVRTDLPLPARGFWRLILVR